jgi:phenylpropionate dioxygenase-like ring-hydroxylating dioxygenase large terminal subunit
MVIEAGLNVDDLVREDRVHGRIYTDQTIFDLEMERIFGRSWVYVAHETEIPEAGDYKSTWIGLQPVIVSRDADDGQVHALYNRCRHRAATVCQQEQGNASYFRCAYHGWTYNNRGDLIGVPYRQGYGAAFTYADYGLVKVPRVESYRGFIFASLSPDGPTLLEHLGFARQYLDYFIDQGPSGILVRNGVHKYGYDGNWKYHLENSCDNYHVDFVHQSTQDIRKLRGNQPTRSVQEANRRADSRVRALGNGHTVNERPSASPWVPLDTSANINRRQFESLEAQIGTEAAKEAYAKGGPVSMTFSIFPNLTLIGYQIRVYFPLTPDRTEVWVYPTSLRDVPEEVNRTRLQLHTEFYGPSGFGSPDDVEMFARAQNGLKAKGNEWLMMMRGLHSETVDENGIRSGELKGETGMRGIYAQWRKLMSMA